MRTLTLTVLISTTALPALADVNIYSYRQPELIEPITSAFTEATGIATNVAFIDKGLTERLKAEGARSPADIIMTVDISRLSDAKEAGVTKAVDSDVLRENIPDSLRDEDGHWFGVTTRARVIYASKDRVPEGEVTTYEDLADPKWRGRICTRSGTHVYTLGLVSAMIAHNGQDATRDWLEGVKANLARPPQGNDRAQVKAIWSGECDISLGNTYYMGKMLEDPEQQAWADAVRIEMPTFADGSGTHVNVSGVAMTASAPNAEDARAFMEFVASPQAQAIYAEANYEYPADPDTPASTQVLEWGDLTPDVTALGAIADNRAEALRLVEQVDFDG